MYIMYADHVTQKRIDYNNLMHFLLLRHSHFFFGPAGNTLEPVAGGLFSPQAVASYLDDAYVADSRA